MRRINKKSTIKTRNRIKSKVRTNRGVRTKVRTKRNKSHVSKRNRRRTKSRVSKRNRRTKRNTKRAIKNRNRRGTKRWRGGSPWKISTNGQITTPLPSSMNAHIPEFINQAKYYKDVLKKLDKLHKSNDEYTDEKYEQNRREVNEAWIKYCKKFDLYCPLHLAYLSAKATYEAAIDQPYKVGVIEDEEYKMVKMNNIEDVPKMPDEE